MIGVILYAPNVHTGGGVVLLQALLDGWPQGELLCAFLDARARARLILPALVKVTWVEPRILSRLNAEIRLRDVSIASSLVFCFHGLPPLLPNAGRVVVFQQNRNYLGLNSLFEFSRKTRLRLAFERTISRLYRHRVSEYIVQSKTMQRALLKWYGASSHTLLPSVKVMPFVNSLTISRERDLSTVKWDFLYVADGEAHKNHRTLLAAWQLLAEEGMYPSLALTLHPRDSELKRNVIETSARYSLKIHDLGQMSHEKVLALYGSSDALVFPSTSESFGLPLIEAAQAGLPILASELDYVRDVCEPVQTFDPHSPVSISRAVKRFLGQPEALIELQTPTAFWSALLSEPINLEAE